MIRELTTARTDIMFIFYVQLCYHFDFDIFIMKFLESENYEILRKWKIAMKLMKYSQVMDSRRHIHVVYMRVSWK